MSNKTQIWPRWQWVPSCLDALLQVRTISCWWCFKWSIFFCLTLPEGLTERLIVCHGRCPMRWIDHKLVKYWPNEAWQLAATNADGFRYPGSGLLPLLMLHLFGERSIIIHYFNPHDYILSQFNFILFPFFPSLRSSPWRRLCVVLCHCVGESKCVYVDTREYSNHLWFAGKLKNPLHPSIPSSLDLNLIRAHNQTLQPADVCVCVSMLVVVVVKEFGG